MKKQAIVVLIPTRKKKDTIIMNAIGDLFVAKEVSKFEINDCKFPIKNHHMYLVVEGKGVVASTDSTVDCSISGLFVKEYVESNGKLNKVFVKYWNEEFIDEDTNEIVMIPRIIADSKDCVIIHKK